MGIRKFEKVLFRFTSFRKYSNSITVKVFNLQEKLSTTNYLINKNKFNYYDGRFVRKITNIFYIRCVSNFQTQYNESNSISKFFYEKIQKKRTSSNLIFNCRQAKLTSKEFFFIPINGFLIGTGRRRFNETISNRVERNKIEKQKII